MKKNIKLEGLDCAVCAGKMEDAISKLPEVKSCRVNFMSQRMLLEVDEDKMDYVLQKSEEIIHGYEPDVVIGK
ncbi:MAG: cation transporter [Anaerovibrio sp.]|uniref:cation transporter n=1 Tax=Anaerovibrio sp. TaxID=1872532 RepID=UPI0025D23041|nr:cation transporter [Anaerovibrio sp.]MCR5175218.1 cation transporter [Anaerovibrio sp.]